MSSTGRAALSELLDFLENAPENQEIIAMDCNDSCEQMACLAEKVARGARLEDLLPELQKHMRYWKDCREEFLALVAVLRAELNATPPAS
ncbi:MAG: hypothetical protein MUE40_17840 [Anaerolineae bacterium]|jgi:hypothetical protein|nr:hypothetical protein [Anaerolineae bacterium]